MTSRIPDRGFALLVLVAMLVPTAGSAEPVWKRGVVASDHPEAAAAGLEILEGGGNAVDAAVATAFALSVVRPYSCGIGGGGFMVLRLTADPRDPARGPVITALDHRERAPRAVDADYYERLDLPEASTCSAHAVAVPGTVAGLLEALERYGTMDRAAVMAPAIRIAETGFAVDRHYLETAAEVAEWIEAEPERKSTHAMLWRRFLGEGRLKAGDRIVNPEQAEALRLIARDGADAFYRGPIADAIVAAVRAAGGPLTAEDLAAFRPKEIAPLTGSFRGRTVITMPPPSSGGIALLEMFGVLDRVEARLGLPLDQIGPDGPLYVHLVTEAMKHAFADRALWLGDPEFVDVPVGRLLDGGYLDTLAARVDPETTLSLRDYGTASEFPDDSVLPEDGGTSHLCVIDGAGNAVACTETINLYFGSRVAVERYGFFLNDEMDDFTTRRGGENAYALRQSERNLPAPGKRPLSSMTPTIVVGADGKVEAMAGGSGGPRIISGTLQVLLNELVFGMGPAEAVGRPRFHHQWWPETLRLEARTDPPAVLGFPRRVTLPIDLGTRTAPADAFGPAWDVVPAGGAQRPGGVDPLLLLVRELIARGHALSAIPSVAVVQTIRRMGDGYAGAGDPRKGGAAFGR